MATLIGNINGGGEGGGGAGATGPTGPTGATGATGPAGPSGTPGSGGGGGGAGVSVYDSGTAYSPGDIVSSSLGIWRNLVASTGVDPDSYSPYDYRDRGQAQVDHSATTAAVQTRISQRFRVSASTHLTTVSLWMANAIAANAGSPVNFVISSSNPATSVTPIASMAYHDALDAAGELKITLDTAPTLSASTDYWMVLAGDIANDVHWRTSGYSPTYISPVNLIADLRVGGGTGIGTTSTTDTHKIGFGLLDDPVQYWTRIASNSLSSNLASYGSEWSSGTYYHLNDIVRSGNGLYIQAADGPLLGYDPATYTTIWMFLTWIVPAGGTTGQALVKTSDTDGDYGWADVSGGGGAPAGLSLLEAHHSGSSPISMTSSGDGSYTVLGVSQYINNSGQLNAAATVDSSAMTALQATAGGNYRVAVSTFGLANTGAAPQSVAWTGTDNYSILHGFALGISAEPSSVTPYAGYDASGADLTFPVTVSTGDMVVVFVVTGAAATGAAGFVTSDGPAFTSATSSTSFGSTVSGYAAYYAATTDDSFTITASPSASGQAFAAVVLVLSQ